MSQQPALKHSWNTMVASSFLDMRLSIACAATDAEYQNRIRIILHDNTLNLPVVAQQPHPDPNYALHFRRLEDQPWRGVVSMSGACSSMQPLFLLAVRRFISRSS